MWTLLAISALLHLYLGARLVPDLPGAASAILLTLALVASALFVPLGLLARRIAKPPAADTLAWIGMGFLGLFSSLLVCTLLRDALLLLAWALVLATDIALPMPAIHRTTAAAVPLLAIAITVIGFLNARRTAQPVRVHVPIDGLAQAFEGYRIVQISDIHVGPTIKGGYLEAIVEAVNRLQPDLVAVTGDLVDGSVQELREHVAPLAKLRARDGAFFVTGNHEYYSGADPWIAELRRLGLRVLMNEHQVLYRGDAALVVAGVPDFSAGHFDRAHQPDPAAALQGSPAGAVKLLLAHQPRAVRTAEPAGFDLQLSGHTHGGQFLPWNFFVRFQQPYTAGLHRFGRLWLYVSRGTGYWGPPKRFGAPSEITELLLVRGDRQAG
jgi:predicted MPP superfamily phosphohydrolase